MAPLPHLQMLWSVDIKVSPDRSVLTQGVQLQSVGLPYLGAELLFTNIQALYIHLLTLKENETHWQKQEPPRLGELLWKFNTMDF